MKMMRIAALLLALGAARSACCGTSVCLIYEGKDLRAWLVAPAVMVTSDTELPAEKTRKEYVLNAGRGECECVQLVIKTNRAIENAGAEFVEPKAGANAIPAKWLNHNKVGHYKYKRGGKVVRLIPDILLPDRKFDLEPDRPNIIWVTVSVPGDAKAGMYECRVRVTAASGTVLDVPLRMKVWDFQVPKETDLVVMGNVWGNLDWFARYTDRPLVECMKEYYDDLKAHRVNATAGIYRIKGHWTPDGEPEGLAEFESVARYVLDELGFKRFRFPGVGGAAGGTWKGIKVFRPVEQDGVILIRGAEFDRSKSNNPKVKWRRWGGASLAPGRNTNGSWVEYDFAAPADIDAHVFVQIDVCQEKESKDIFLDGERLGTVTGADCVKDDLGFTRLPGRFKIKAGKHTLRIVVGNVIGISDPICNAVFSKSPAPDLAKILLGSERLTDEFKKAFRYHVEHAAEHLRKHGWLSKAQLKLKDEPSLGEYARVAKLYEFAREILPDGKFELSEGPHPILWKGVNVWTPYATFPRFNPEACAERQRNGDEVWLYYNILHSIGAEPIGMQLIPWMLFRYDLDGYLFWSVNYWKQDPYERHEPDENCALRGTMMYPDPRDGSPVNSVRWELFREGMEDYACLEFIERNVKKLRPDNARHRRLLAAWKELRRDISEKLVTTTMDFSKDPAVLADFRSRMYELAEQLNRASPKTK